MTSQTLSRSQNAGRSSRRRRGSVLVYTTAALIVGCGFVSLAVDYGRVQLVKTELQTAADLSARYAASGVKHQIDGVNAATAMANASLSENKADNKLIKTSQATVEIGTWKSSNKKFTLTTDASVANAVRVTVKCQASDGTILPLSFASVIGFSKKELTASAIALWDADGSGTGNSSAKDDTSYVQNYVPATSNMWLAGEPKGTVASLNNPHNNPDYAGNNGNAKQSPVEMTGLRISPGSTLTFDGINGGANNLASDQRFTGDGDTATVVQNLSGAELSKSNISAPINSVIAVFLNDNVPSGTAPTSLDFSTTASRDFQTLKPVLRQVFFIGDGRRDNGDMQQFVVPAGATRLVIGTMDSYEWNNNVGGFTVTATATARILIVK